MPREADRDSQTRTTITDGAYGKPWVFRPKDLEELVAECRITTGRRG